MAEARPSEQSYIVVAANPMGERIRYVMSWRAECYALTDDRGARDYRGGTRWGPGWVADAVEIGAVAQRVPQAEAIENLGELIPTYPKVLEDLRAETTP